MNAITVCVGYEQTLAITLPRNRKYFDRYMVVTFEDSPLLSKFARGYGLDMYFTDAFYRNGALFNKGLSLELGLDALGRNGWLMILDADILLPDKLPEFTEGNLYSPYRRMCYDPCKWKESDDWKQYRRYPDREFAGYCQVFHADDPVLKTRPWYGTNWTHAGGCDSDFQARWPDDKKIRPDFEVLHFGQPAKNWGGRGDEQRKKLQQLLSQRRRIGDYARERVSHG